MRLILFVRVSDYETARGACERCAMYRSLQADSRYRSGILTLFFPYRAIQYTHPNASSYATFDRPPAGLSDIDHAFGFAADAGMGVCTSVLCLLPGRPEIPRAGTDYVICSWVAVNALLVSGVFAGLWLTAAVFC